MFFSLIQTLVCVLLINGGLYALHLTGNGNGNSGGNGGGAGGTGAGIGLLPSSQSQSQSIQNANEMLNLLAAGGQQHLQHTGGGGGGLKPKPKSLDSGNGRLSAELADMVQTERERLMMLGLAKQTAAANAGTSHHGRPIITGRIQMTPAEDIEGDYSPLLLQPARGVMFGNVVKQPAESEDYESEEEFDGGGAHGIRRPLKYEYGRIVQPSDREYEQPQHIDLDGYIELDPEEEILPDLDGYQYLDEILAEQEHKTWPEEQPQSVFGQHHGYHTNAHSLNPFQTLEELEANPSLSMQRMFEKDQHEGAPKTRQQQDQEPVNGGAKPRNGPYNIRLQQKWQRKRSQQQQQQQRMQQWQRNIFGHQKQQQPHRYNAQHSKLSIANSEATATKHIDKAPPLSSSAAAAEAAAAAMQSSSTQQQQQQLLSAAMQKEQKTQSQPLTENTAANGDATASAKNAKANIKQQQQPQQQQQKAEKFLHPNRKRSGGVSAASASGGYAGGMQSPATHSIASQLMLRTARGQRQYDVPQIECPTAMDGMERFACPTPDLQGRYRCIDDHVLCDGFIDCPEGEDEDRRSCMFYKTTKAHLDVLADALLRWARGR